AGVESPYVDLSTAQRNGLRKIVDGMRGGNPNRANENARAIGVTAVFNGRDAVGKINAGIALANQIGATLYRVDLSRVVSKYIGETEKNLQALFEDAARQGAILFFDEADSLFGKRTGVKDSHDRYANVEIDYLLQLMESYDGIAILSSNFKRNIDQAFTRRLRFKVDFPS
ncbi:MAG TPA: ATP-binding protein, partial [Candidatus Binatus sp.]|nr:ATP-binding protein [Candidatus Binatus sp.]